MSAAAKMATIIKNTTIIPIVITIEPSQFGTPSQHRNSTLHK